MSETQFQQVATAAVTAAVANVPADENVVYLGDPAAIGMLLQEQAANIADLYMQVIEKKITADDATSVILARTHALASIFLGKDPEHYAPMGNWNTDGQVAAYVSMRLFSDQTGAPEDILASAFAVLFREVHDQLAAANAGTTAPSDAADNINANLSDWARMLVGMLPEPTVLEEPAP